MFGEKWGIRGAKLDFVDMEGKSLPQTTKKSGAEVGQLPRKAGRNRGRSTKVSRNDARKRRTRTLMRS